MDSPEQIAEALRAESHSPGMGWLKQAAALIERGRPPSQSDQKAARLNALQLIADEANRLAGAGDIESSAQAVAMSMAALVSFHAEDERKSWTREREREKAFGAELERLTEDPNVLALPPEARNACLRLLAQSISEGWDGPPNAEDYAEAIALVTPHPKPRFPRQV